MQNVDICLIKNLSRKILRDKIMAKKKECNKNHSLMVTKTRKIKYVMKIKQDTYTDMKAETKNLLRWFASSIGITFPGIDMWE